MAPSTTRVWTVAEGRAQRARGEHDHEAADRGAPGRSAFDLALFDLDFTLIPSDSGLRWARFMVAEGALPRGTDEAYVDVCRAYVAGRKSIEELHRFAAERLLAVPIDDIPVLQDRFEALIRTELPTASSLLVARHQRKGDLCCIVTTTNEIVAWPFARAFGIEHLLASRPRHDGVCFPGDYTGPLCHGTEKVVRLRTWLLERGGELSSPVFAAGQAERAGVMRTSVFYSDSITDLPLLEWADVAVAVNPDPRLRSYAEACSWRVIERLE